MPEVIARGSFRRLAIFLGIAAVGIVLGFWPSAPAGHQGQAQESNSVQEADEVPSKEEGQSKEDWSGKVMVVPVTKEDLTDGRRFRAFRDLVELAEERDVALLVYEINVASVPSDAEGIYERLIETLSASQIRSAALVRPAAVGPGAMIALGSDAIYVSPAAILGGMAPGGVTAVDDDESASSANATSVSVLKARVRGLATLRGHRAEVAEAFVDPRQRLQIGDTLISEEGDVLTLTAKEAIAPHDGRPVLALAIVPDVKALLEEEQMASQEVLVRSPQDHLRDHSSRLADRADAKPRGSGEPIADEPAGGAGAAEEASDEAAPEGEVLFGKRQEESYAGKILVLPIGMEDLISEARFDFMERTLAKAEADGAAALIFDMDTPGGYAWQTQDLILNQLQGLSYPVYTFVNTRAESAGAIIAIGTDAIYMRPAASIGSALVVTSMGGELPENMDQKVTQAMIAMVRNVAEIKGHNPDVAEAFVSKDKEVVIDGVVVSPAGTVLNLNTTQATERYDGRPLLAKGVANSVEEIIELEGLEGELHRVEPLGMERFAQLIQRFSFLLIILGLAGAYMELNAPGFGVPGVVSLLAFGLFFFGNHFAGNLAGYELAVLLVLGLILVAIEVFVLPGTVIPGLVGGLLVLTSLALAMVDRYDFDAMWRGLPEAPSATEVLLKPAMKLALSLLGAILVLPLLLRFLPETRAMRWAILDEALPTGASLSVPAVDATTEGAGGEGDPGSGEGQAEALSATLIGLSGEATTDLRPAGKAQIGGRLLDVVSEGEFIEKGSGIAIVKHEGSRIVVERAV